MYYNYNIGNWDSLHLLMNNNSYIRIFHASPGSPPVDVYVENRPVLKGLRYKGFSQFLPIRQGNYNIKVYPSGQKDNPVINENIRVLPNSALTLAAIGVLPRINLLRIPEPYMPTPLRNKSYVRFIHLSPNAPAVDITLPDGTKIFNDVDYTTQTKYTRFNPGTYTLQVRPSGGNQVVLTIPSLKLEPEGIYTIYAVGLVGDSPLLEAVVTKFEKFQ